MARGKGGGLSGWMEGGKGGENEGIYNSVKNKVKKTTYMYEKSCDSINF